MMMEDMTTTGVIRCAMLQSNRKEKLQNVPT